MVLGTVMSVVHSLLAALQCSQLKDICSILGYKLELDHLYDTVIAVRVVLLDAGAKQELPHEPQLWIQELKDVVYDADDLVDEFVTLAEQKHLIEMAYELHSMLTDVVSLMTWEKVMPVYGGRNDNDSFLTKVVSPFYRVISEEAEKSKNGTADHSKWRNYDDLNEYFW